MIIRAIDSDNDWTFGQGKQSYLTAARAIDQNIQTRLMSWLNDTFWAMDFGVDWRNLIGGKNPAAQNGIILQCRTVLAASFGVVRVNKVDASLDSNRRLLLAYTVDTIYSRAVTGQITVT